MQYICIVEDKESTALPTWYNRTSVTLYGRGESVVISRSAGTGTRGGMVYGLARINGNKEWDSEEMVRILRYIVEAQNF
jgi:hypothetical protein